VGGKLQRHGRNKAGVIRSVLRGGDVGPRGEVRRLLGAASAQASAKESSPRFASVGNGDGSFGGEGSVGGTYVWRGLFVDDSLAEVTSPDLVGCEALQRVLFART